MKYLVTGATGFIGSHLLNQLISANNEVYALRRPGSKPHIFINEEPIWINGNLDDLRDQDFTGVDCLIHLAAHGVESSKANWQECFRWNVTSSLELWLRGARAGIENFLICGSCFEYGRSAESFEFIPTSAPLLPTGPYHASKAAATMAASAFAETEKKKVWVLRPFHVFGDGESSKRLYPQILAAARSGKDLPLTGGNQVRDFINVREVARLLYGYSLLLSGSDKLFHISNLGSGDPRPLKAFITQIWTEEKATGQLLFGALPYRDNEVMRYVPKIDKAEQDAAIEALLRLDVP